MGDIMFENSSLEKLKEYIYSKNVTPVFSFDKKLTVKLVFTNEKTGSKNILVLTADNPEYMDLEYWEKNIDQYICCVKATEGPGYIKL